MVSRIRNSRVCEWDLQHATDRGDSGEEIDIVELWHMHVGDAGGQQRRILQPVRGFPNQTIDKRIEIGWKGGKEKKR